MKDEVILKVENLSKQYRLGLVGTGTLSHDFNRWWHRIRGKEDPYLKIGDTNDRSTKGETEYIWALRDVNFEIKRGEVIGFIGSNGAGKSTLLKLLSNVTKPSGGNIKTRGRIASLLEVGTGFHSEMTGRENIYLNGAILGMNKNEISERIEEIIDFSGCRRYIDTPVKRYSSGMTVRLAFSVAAFLDSEIFIIDEVLAVGDSEFQKKALDKIKGLAGDYGRTILLVSHNMKTILSLADRVYHLKQGKIVNYGCFEPSFIIDKYINNAKNKSSILVNKEKFVYEFKLKKEFDLFDDLIFNLAFNKLIKDNIRIYIDFALIKNDSDYILHYRMMADNKSVHLTEKTKNVQLTVHNPGINIGEYFINLHIHDEFDETLLWIENIDFIEIKDKRGVYSSPLNLKSSIIPRVTLE